MSRKLSFKIRESRLGDCPQVVPIDKESGDEIDYVRKCEVVSSAQDATVMRLEILVFNEGFPKTRILKVRDEDLE